MPSLEPDFLENLRFSKVELSKLKTIGEYRGKQALYTHQTPQVLEALRQVSAIESTESSNRIEGILAPHLRVEQLVLHFTQPKNRSEQEIAGYRDALSLIHESGKDMPFSKNVILQLHQMLYHYSSGRGGHWKMQDNQIVEKNSEGKIHRIRFSPVPAVSTPQAMDDLLGNYKLANQAHQAEPLIFAPLVILDFLCIHPFADGNGRTARLLTLMMLLYQMDIEVGRYISLERVYEQTKETYYEALEKSSIHWHESKHDVFPWLNYFWGTLLAAYREFEQRVGVIKKGKGSKTDQVISAVNRSTKPFSIRELERDCPGVGRDMIRLVLRELRDQGKIKVKGFGVGARWEKI